MASLLQPYGDLVLLAARGNLIIRFGFAGQVDGVVERMPEELATNPEEVKVVATGGMRTHSHGKCAGSVSEPRGERELQLDRVDLLTLDGDGMPPVVVGE